MQPSSLTYTLHNLHGQFSPFQFFSICQFIFMWICPKERCSIMVPEKMLPPEICLQENSPPPKKLFYYIFFVFDIILQLLIFKLFIVTSFRGVSRTPSVQISLCQQLFGATHGMVGRGGAKRPHLPKICYSYPTRG